MTTCPFGGQYVPSSGIPPVSLGTNVLDLSRHADSPCSYGLSCHTHLLEFLAEPGTALAEAARVARQGILLIVLNRWSPGGPSRRWGSQARRPLLIQAHDYSVVSLWATVYQATAGRWRQLHWTSTLFPAGCWRARVPLPVGEVLGMAVECTASAATPDNG
jgi:hypothetical protein